jgi:hypothetical protein
MPHVARDSNTSTANSDVLTNPTSLSSLDNVSPIDRAYQQQQGLQQQRLPQTIQQRNANIQNQLPPLSPAVSGFSFKDEMDPPSPTSMGPYGEVQPVQPMNSHSPVSPKEFEAERQRRASRAMSKANIQRFEDNFQYKEHHDLSAVEKIRREAPVVAELRTNVIVSFWFINELV